mmetsp:Transcript_7241/g.18184  ORF Transcript_7241/g.18184 Transcript_7241/m.18184 type:complete len:97 (-) Transcript_7241:12-302(-)
MLRGLPSRLHAHHLTSALDKLGLADTYLSLNIPCRGHGARPTNKGYGFVKFKNAAFAEECHRLLHGRLLDGGLPAADAHQKFITVELQRDEVEKFA